MIAACPGNHFCGCKPSTFATTPCSAELCQDPTHVHLTPEQREELRTPRSPLDFANDYGRGPASKYEEERKRPLSLPEARQLANLLARHIEEDEWNADCSTQLTLDRLHDAIDAGLDCR